MPESVYVIGSAGSYVVKIGVTSNIDRRLREIQNMSPQALEVRWSCNGNQSLEQALHHHFGSYRRHGEWFEFPHDPVPLVQCAVRILEVVKQELGGYMLWPGAPRQRTDREVALWLLGKIHRQLSNRLFTFGEVASVIGAPRSFVEHFGRQLLEMGNLVDQGRGQQGEVLVATRFVEDWQVN
ncbi:GIY-YIG nuclease family protein [Streptomyces sp. NPDC054847]